jgi:nitroreductase
VDAYLAIASRREVRDYADRPLPAEVERRILEAGRVAGSSQNRQRRRFVVLRDRALVERVADVVYMPRNVLGAALVVAVVTGGRGPLAFDAGRAAQNMLLAAWSDGVGSCPNGVADQDAMRAALALDEGEQVAIVLTFGYPAHPVAPERRSAEDWLSRANRLPYEEVVEER